MKSIQESLTALRSGDAPPERSRDYWNKSDLENLNQWFWEGQGISQIAVQMGRTEVAIYQKLLKLGLLSPQCIPRPKNPKPVCCDCLCPNCHNTNCPNYGKE